jgi:hypothetical protein
MIVRAEHKHERERELEREGNAMVRYRYCLFHVQVLLVWTLIYRFNNDQVCLTNVSLSSRQRNERQRTHAVCKEVIVE